MERGAGPDDGLSPALPRFRSLAERIAYLRQEQLQTPQQSPRARGYKRSALRSRGALAPTLEALVACTEPGQSGIDLIVRLVAACRGIHPDILLTRDNSRDVMAARHFCAWLADRLMPNMKPREIGQALADHTERWAADSVRAIDSTMADPNAVHVRAEAAVIERAYMVLSAQQMRKALHELEAELRSPPADIAAQQGPPVGTGAAGMLDEPAQPAAQASAYPAAILK